MSNINSNNIFSLQNKLIQLLFIIILFGPIFSYLLPVDILGISLFNVFFPLLLIVIILSYNIKLNIYIKFLIFFIISYLVILFLRYFIYGESFLQATINNFYAIYFLLLFILFRNNPLTTNTIKFISKIIFISLIFNFVNTIFFLLDLPNINAVNELSEDFIENSRFVGIMGGANVQANFVVIQLFLFISINKHRSILFRIIIIFCTLIAILPTLSRGGILFWLICLITLFTQLQIKYLLLFILSIIILLAQTNIIQYFNILDGVFDSLNNRMLNDDISNGRIDLFNLFIDRMLENGNTFIIGIEQTKQFGQFGISFSDNSFILLISNLGFCLVIFFIFYIIFFLSQLKLYGAEYKLYLIGTFFIFTTNNTLLHLHWSYLSVFGFYLLNKLKSDRCTL